MKILFLILFLSSPLMAEERAVYLLFKSSFTAEQLTLAKEYINTEKFNEPGQKIYEVLDSTITNQYIVVGDATALASAVAKIPAEKYKLIGIYSYSKEGYDRTSTGWKAIKDFFIKP